MAMQANRVRPQRQRNRVALAREIDRAEWLPELVLFTAIVIAVIGGAAALGT